MAKKRRPCPRGLYDGCPIPRELCSEDFDRTGHWHCIQFLKEFEWFVFGSGEDDPAEGDTDVFQGRKIVSMEDLMAVVNGVDEQEQS
jgi:hypothetical protein